MTHILINNIRTIPGLKNPKHESLAWKDILLTPMRDVISVCNINNDLNNLAFFATPTIGSTIVMVFCRMVDIVPRIKRRIRRLFTKRRPCRQGRQGGWRLPNLIAAFSHRGDRSRALGCPKLGLTPPFATTRQTRPTLRAVGGGSCACPPQAGTRTQREFTYTSEQ